MNRNRWMVLGAAVAAALFAGLASALHTDWAIALDNRMADLLEGNRLLEFFTIFGDVRFIAIALLVGAIMLYIKRDWVGLLFLGISLGGGTILNQGLKQVFARQRPDIPDQLASFSFPSGHSQMGLLYLLTLALLFAGAAQSRAARRLIWAGILLLAVLIGSSRIALGRHFATDVLGGWLLGTAWFLLIAVLFIKYGGRSLRRKA
ncbi:phosphatase PAP2 family protein [Bhargavaea ullalensis]|uniref:Undecaprenyl-diphosphatase n=1 Tax=Bhargavaea ullalensis TaxID=1265685 RepID=A0ABV2GE18_9BACL